MQHEDVLHSCATAAAGEGEDHQRRVSRLFSYRKRFSRVSWIGSIVQTAFVKNIQKRIFTFVIFVNFENSH